MKKQFNARRADRRAAVWARRNAALFSDNLEAQLRASLEAHRPPRISETFSPLEVIAIRMADQLTRELTPAVRLITDKLSMAEAISQESRAAAIAEEGEREYYDFTDDELNPNG